jgi:competence protein ComEC
LKRYLIIISLIFLVLFSGILYATTLKAYFLHVGQGDSTIIIVSTGEVVLIDSGPNENLILNKLQELRISHIDLLIASHPHTDHITGMDKIINKYKPRALIDPEIPSSTDTFEKLLDAVYTNRVKYNLEPAQKFKLGPLVINLNRPKNKLDENSDPNHNSVVFKLEFGKIAFLFPGDIDGTREDQLIRTTKNQLNANILKVSHHGSFHGTTAGFIQAVNPQVAIISCGKDNLYGYPHQETINTLTIAKVQIYRTDLNGTVLVKTDGNTYEVISEIGNAQEPSEKVIQTLISKTDSVQESETNGIMKYAASKKSKVFHKITCVHVGTIKEDNLIVFNTLEEALATGRRGCKTCEPENLEVEPGKESSEITEKNFLSNSGNIEEPESISEYQYAASKISKVFHKITCPHVATIKKENLIYFHSLEEAQKSGRRGCKTCKPEE